jgi:hypothetical protein
MFYRLRKDMQNIIKILSADEGEEKGSVESGDGEMKKKSEKDGDDGEKVEAGGLVIITALVTSCIR